MAILSLGLNPLSKFEGANAVTPKEREMCYDDVTGDIYVWKLVDGIWTKYSRTAEIQKKLDELEASGVFASSAAFVSNRKIYRFYYDEDNGVVRIDPDLRFDSLYRYYAIRSIETSEDGSFEYITGVTGTTAESGDITSSLVNMDLEDSESGDGTQVSVPQVGGLIGKVTAGNSYMVEFYDINRNLVNIQAYQAIKVRTASTDLCPDTAITDMYVVVNQQNADGGIYLYQGQDINELEIQTTVKYADGRRRDVSSEETYGGRLIIQGLDEIDTSTITGTGGKKQEIEVVYQMVRSNTSFSSNSSYRTENGATITPAAYTIKLTVPVTIVQDTYSNLESLIPVGYVAWDDTLATPAYVVKMKFFGHYSSGIIADITNIVMASGTPYSQVPWGQSQTITVQVPYGNANQYKTFTFQVQVPNYPTDGSSYSLRVRTYGEQSRFVTFDESQTSGGSYSGKFTGFSVATDSGTSIVSASDLKNLDKVMYNSIVPTHLRIRAVKDFYDYTGIVSIDSVSTGIWYKTTAGHELDNDTPLLVEFIYVDVDEETGNAISTQITGAIGHYAAKASS